ncbi:MAG: DUF5316 domain-containing protein, partial [Methylocystaceae bacterium]
ILIPLFTGNWQVSIRLSSLAGVGGLILAMILSGSLKSGDGMRAMYAQEDKIDRELRTARVSWLAMFALPNIVAAILLYRLT